MRSHTGRLWQAAALCCGVLAVFILGCGSGAEVDEYDPTVVQANNRGVALMGRFDFESARVVFQSLVDDHPADSDLRVNLAVAVLNRQQEGDAAAAEEILDAVLADDTDHIRAAYVRGLLRLHRGEAESALEDFRAVADADPSDSEAVYYVGQSLMQIEEFEEAFGWFQRAADLDPYLRSAHYRAFQALQRLGRADEATEYIEAFQSLDGNPRARLMEFKYTKMGRHSEVVVIGSDAVGQASLSEGEVFGSVVPMVSGWEATTDNLSGRAPNLTACDLDGDGGLDFFIAGSVSRSSGGPNTLLMGSASDGLVVTDHPLAMVAGVNTALWGDVDNDGRNDVYLCRKGPNELWLQQADGEWTKVAKEAGVSGGDLDTVDGALFDADHDGDLDVFLVNADGANELLNNNRDGRFRPLAAETGLGGNGGESRAVVVSDLNADLVADLVVVNRQPPHEVYLNRLLWDYDPASGWDVLKSTAMIAAVAGDVDADGKVELYTLGEDASVRRWTDNSPENWSSTSMVSSADGDDPNARLEIADVDGDGVLDLLVTGRSGWRLVSAIDGSEMAAGDEALTNAGLYAIEPDRGPSLIGWSTGQEPVMMPPGNGRFSFVAMALSGLDDEAASMRTNASGIGTRLAARVGSRWTVMDTLRKHSGPGQSLQPLLIGLGGAEAIDFVAIDWSDAVFQTEMNLASGELHEIVETQRQMSSCPVLFAWNGERFVFVTDFLGVGGIGYAVGPGEYSEPRPWENIMLPAGAVEPKDGRLIVKLTEPMEEAAYFDAARMVAYDIPPEWSLVIDDRMAILGPKATGRTFLYHRVAAPVRATNERGEDVTEAMNSVDHRAAPVGELDRRFIGRLAGEHVLTLEFETALNWLGRRLALVADGWVEYPYSSTSFAAWQAGADYRAPTLEARGADGRWTMVLEQFGYPAGMPRQMSVPLPRLPAGTTAIRLRSNMEVYWDRIIIVGVEVNEEIIRHDLALLSAEVEQIGFALRTTGSQRLPHYDHGRRTPLWDTRVQPGRYTEFGDATELIAAADDALAIIGPGEGVHIEFAAPSDDPPPGWTRIFVLETEGWCKDMDLYTKGGANLTPIPAAGRASSATVLLQGSHNTRWNGS